MSLLFPKRQVTMKEIEIIKLPLIGSPFSYKTYKQGRRTNIDYDIQKTNERSMKHLKKMVNENSQKIERIEEFFNHYKPGKNNFLDSIHRQIRQKGFSKLSKCQIDAVKRTLKIT